MRYTLQTLEGNLNSDSPTPRQWAPWEFGVIALLGAAVIAVSWPWMTRIGLYYDEAWSLPAAVRIALGSPQEISFPDGLYLFGRPFPFMVGAYIGPLDAYLYGLVFAIFGVNLLAFRFVNLAVSFVVVAVTYSLTRQMSGRLTAAIAALFLVLDVEFLLRAPTNNVGPILLQILASAAAVMFLMRTTEHRSSQRPAAALFCLGLGISEKLTFLLFLPSLLIAALLFYRRAILDRINPRICIIATAAFLMGCLPIVLHFGGNPNAAFRLTHTYSHSPNADTLQERSEQFKTLITGQWSINYIAGQVAEPGFWRFRSSMPLDGKIGRFSVVWWLFLLSLTLGALALARRLVQRAPLSAEARLCGFLSALCLGVVGCSAFVGEGGKTHHLLLVFPFIHCLAAITLVRAWKWAGVRQGVVRGVVALVLLGSVIATAGSTLQNMLWHNRHVSRTGGTGVFASEISELAAWIAQHPESHYFFVTWGLYRPVYTLTAGKCPCTERWGALVPAKPRADGYWEKQLSRQDAVFVFGNSFHPSTNQEKLFQIARDLGMQARLIKQFHHTSTGQLLYEAYSFASHGNALGSPPI